MKEWWAGERGADMSQEPGKARILDFFSSSLSLGKEVIWAGGGFWNVDTEIGVDLSHICNTITRSSLRQTPQTGWISQLKGYCHPPELGLFFTHP